MTWPAEVLPDHSSGLNLRLKINTIIAGLDSSIGRFYFVGDPTRSGMETVAAAVATLTAAAIHAILILPPGDHAVNADLNVGEKITVYPLPGANLIVATGKICTIECLHPDVGRYAWATLVGTGQLILGKRISHRFSEWFGAIPGANNTLATQQMIASVVAGDRVTFHLPESEYSDVIVINKDHTTINTGGSEQRWAAGYAQSNTNEAIDWYTERHYNVMFVANADDVNFYNLTFKQGTAFTHSGFPIWFAIGVKGGSVTNCQFYDLAYDGAAIYGVCIQIRSGAVGVVEQFNRFYNCKGGVVCQGSYCHIGMGDISRNDNANGATDAMWSIDGGYGNILHPVIFYRTQSCPVSGAVIQISGTKNFQVIKPYLQGLKGGCGIYVWDPVGGGVQGVDGGIIDGAIIDGGGLTATEAFAMLKITQHVKGVKVINCILRNPASGEGYTSSGLVITPGNTAYHNDIDMGTEAGVYAAVRVVPTHAGGEKELYLEENDITAANRGVFFDGVTNNAMKPMWLIRNKYKNMTEAIGSNPSAPLSNNAPVYLVGDGGEFTGSNFTTLFVDIPKAARAFSHGAKNFPYRIAEQVEVHSSETPNVTDYTGTTWKEGDTFRRPAPPAGASPGDVCVSGGTFSPALAMCHTTVSSNVVFVFSGTGFYEGDTVIIAGVTGKFKILSITGPNYTLDGTTDAEVTDYIFTVYPVFKAMPALAA